MQELKGRYFAMMYECSTHSNRYSSQASPHRAFGQHSNLILILMRDIDFSHGYHQRSVHRASRLELLCILRHQVAQRSILHHHCHYLE